MTDCHPVGPGQRALGPTHDGEHDRCEPCTDRHCGRCGRRHVRPADDDTGDPGELTCPRCIGVVRTDLADVVAWHDQLEDEAAHHPNDAIPGGTATVMLAAVSLEYPAVQARRILDAVDQAATEGRTVTDDELARLTADDPLPSDPPHPLFVLARWEDAWRDALDATPGPRPATVHGAADWLTAVLPRIAHHDAFGQFADDLRSLKRSLEAVLRAGTRPVRGVPCIVVGCEGLLVQAYRSPKPCTHETPWRQRARALVGWNRRVHRLGYPEIAVGAGEIRAALRAARRPCERTGCDQGGRRDRWQCTACKRTYDQADYERAKVHHEARVGAA